MAILDSRSGKDTFVNYCKKHTYWCLNISTVDFVKEIAAQCGWDGTKTPKNREFLSNLKDLLTEWNDVPYTKILREIDLFRATMECHNFEPDKEGIVFIHCREPKEITKLVKNLNALSLLIRRPAIENIEQSNHADAEVFNYDYDTVIYNDGTFEDLDKKAYQFLQSLNIQHLL